jgi:hypothetical protein
MRLCELSYDSSLSYSANPISVILTIANVIGAVLIITILEHYFRECLVALSSLAWYLVSIVHS